MHLISRVNKSGVIAARSHIVSPVTQSLLIFATVAYIGVGIAGYIKDGDVEQFRTILLMAFLIIGEYLLIPYIIAIGRFQSLQLFYDTDVLNFHVHFGNEYMRIVGIDGVDVGDIDYSEITKCVDIKDMFVLIAGFHIFIFDEESVEKTGLRRHLVEHGVSVGKCK